MSISHDRNVDPVRPSRTAGHRRRRACWLVAALALLVAGCGSSTGSSGTSGAATSAAPAVGTAAVVRVPDDAATITAALQQVAPGGLVLIGPGTYRESVAVTVPGVTLRGTDRNSVIIDGEALRPNGIVVSADGVTVQNLTVEQHTFYGVLVSGMPGGGTGHQGSQYDKLDPSQFPPVQRFAVDHVTAINNGLYGIYAFDAQHGVIKDSYASGSADSGFYVGQCRDCDITVRGNVAERNAVGFENANASDSVYVVANRWSGNRVGLTILTSYQEAFVPQHGSAVVGNLISANTEVMAPEQATGGFGIGVGIAGGQSNLVARNTISGHPSAGILLANAEDVPAIDNSLQDNTFQGSTIAIADISAGTAASSGNCITGAVSGGVEPATLAASSCPTGSPASAGIPATGLPAVPVPAGLAFLDVARPKAQPNLTDVAQPPATLPAQVGPPADLDSLTAPPDTLLADLSGTG